MVAGAAVEAAPAPPTAIRVLVFTKTAEFRHDSIPAARRALAGLAAQNALAVDGTEDAGVFDDATLARYDVVAFVLTTGDVLDDGQQAAFQRFIRRGRGFVGIHSAADTEHAWPWYRGLVGAWFRSHPPVQPATVHVEDRRALSTGRLATDWPRIDEWYAFDRNPRGAVHVLATVDEATYTPDTASMGRDHPIAWQHAYDGGRAWYTAMGHTEASYADPVFLRHVLGGILYAAGFDAPAFASVSVSSRAGRISVSVRHSRCRACRARLTVAGRTTPLRESERRALGESARLRPGRFTVRVALTEPVSGLTATATRVVRVPRS
jgi:type 1 glutamine amidotransferase